MGELYRLNFAGGKSYVGITKFTAKARYAGHERGALRGSMGLVACAWRKHGAPRLTVLAVLKEKDLLSAEQRAIKIFDTLAPNGYNVTPGGDAPPMSVPAVAAKLIGRPRPDWVRKAISAKHQGKKLSAEHRAKLSAAQRRPENVARLAARNLSRRGRKLTVAHRANISAGNKGKKRSPAQCLNMSLGRRGIYPSLEARARMSASAKRRWSRGL